MLDDSETKTSGTRHRNRIRVVRDEQKTRFLTVDLTANL